MKAAEGSGGARRMFGSLDRQLMRKCPCPVYIVNPSDPERFTRTLAPVDLNPMHPVTESLARRIVELAPSLAEEDGSELHVLHVWRLVGEVMLRGRTIHTTDVQQLLDKMEDAHRVELDRLLEAYPYERTTSHLVKGDADDVIPDFADELDVDLVVIGTVGRTGVPGLLIGNTAERVLDSVDCPVLTLKPEGFQSPVMA